MQLQLLEYNFGCETQPSGKLFKFVFTFFLFSFNSGTDPSFDSSDNENIAIYA